MYYVQKRMEISACHHLNLNYESKCANLHGHNWIITVYCKAGQLNSNGMVIDFTEIKKNISEKLDLTEDEKSVFNLISIENKGFDEIIQNTALKFEDLMLILTTLEIKGYIKQVDGDKYQSLVKI